MCAAWLAFLLSVSSADGLSRSYAELHQAARRNPPKTRQEAKALVDSKMGAARSARLSSLRDQSASNGRRFQALKGRYQKLFTAKAEAASAGARQGPAGTVRTGPGSSRTGQTKGATERRKRSTPAIDGSKVPKQLEFPGSGPDSGQ